MSVHKKRIIPCEVLRSLADARPSGLIMAPPYAKPKGPEICGFSSSFVSHMAFLPLFQSWCVG
jgi:hypothetical protein